MLKPLFKLLLLAIFAFLANSKAQAGTFLLRDPRGPNQISEVTRFYLDGKLAAVIKLHDGMDAVEKLITTSDGRLAHHYALCGEVKVLNNSGEIKTILVESEGILHRPDGHVLMAAADDDLQDFYIIDTTEPGSTEHHKGKVDICSGPVS